MPELNGADIMPDLFPSWEWYRERADSQQRSRRNAHLPVVALPRNGLPEPGGYAYGGTGEDQLAGSYGDQWLDEPDD
jgi:hypothetical protein